MVKKRKPAKPKNGHTWKKYAPKPDKTHFEFKDPKTGAVSIFDIKFNLILAPGLNVKKCQKCGQEMVNGKEPEESCEEHQARQILEK